VSTRKYQCPVCGLRFLADAEQMFAGGAISLVRGDSAVREVTGDRSVDLECPHCHNQWEVTVEA